jgi:hypothetical protein
VTAAATHQGAVAENLDVGRAPFPGQPVELLPHPGQVVDVVHQAQQGRGAVAASTRACWCWCCCGWWWSCCCCFVFPGCRRHDACLDVLEQLAPCFLSVEKQGIN